MPLRRRSKGARAPALRDQHVQAPSEEEPAISCDQIIIRYTRTTKRTAKYDASFDSIVRRSELGKASDACCDHPAS